VTLSDITPDKARELKLPAVSGAIVDSVEADSAAAKAGLKPNDVIVGFDGLRVRSVAELRRLIRETPPGRTVAINLLRDGKPLTLSATLRASANPFNFIVPDVRVPRLQEIPPAYGPRHVTLGITADDLTPQLAQFFGVKQGKGALITEVSNGSAAERAGLKAGDVIVELDGRPIAGVEQLRFALNHFLDDPHNVRMTIVRDRHEKTVHADLSRFQIWEQQTSSQAAPLPGAVPESLQPPAALPASQASELQAEAERQRALVQAEVRKQQQYLNTEWQREVQEEMNALKDYMKPMQTLHLVSHHKDEI